MNMRAERKESADIAPILDGGGEAIGAISLSTTD
jgi:hypothetical protein